MCGRDSDLSVTCSLISVSHLPPAELCTRTDSVTCRNVLCMMLFHVLESQIPGHTHTLCHIHSSRPTAFACFLQHVWVEGFPWFCCGFGAGVFLKKLLNILSLMLTLIWCTSYRRPNGDFSMCVRIGRLPGQNCSLTTKKNKNTIWDHVTLKTGVMMLKIQFCIIGINFILKMLK